jgi:hypothetical protein
LETSPPVRPAKVVSGGQTGVDRAALDAAREAGIPTGGWCPAGGRAEDLEEPPGLLALYPELAETPSPNYAERTEWNVRDSDGTLVLMPAAHRLTQGTAMTVDLARRLGRPVVVLDPGGDGALEEARAFIDGLGEAPVLNLAGPRESGVPGVYESSRTFLGQLFER